MKKIKMTFSLLIIIFVALLIYQNRVYFFAEQALSFSLGVETWNWTAQPLPNVLYMAGCLLIGLIISGYMCLRIKFRAKKTAKELNAAIASGQETIAALKSELETFKNDPYQKIEKQTETQNLAASNDPPPDNTEKKENA